MMIWNFLMQMICQEKFPQSAQISQKPPAEPDTLMEGRDVRQSLGKLLGGKGTHQTATPIAPR